MMTHPSIRREDIQDSADYFARRIVQLTGVPRGKGYIIAYGRALNSQCAPTASQHAYFVISWRAIRALLAGWGYGVEYERLRQLYGISELHYRDAIARRLADLWGRL